MSKSKSFGSKNSLKVNTFGDCISKELKKQINEAVKRKAPVKK